MVVEARFTGPETSFCLLNVNLLCTRVFNDYLLVEGCQKKDLL